MSLTFALIKSRAIRRGLHKTVLAMILEQDFTIEYAQFIKLSPEIRRKLYAQHLEASYWEYLDYSVSKGVIALVLSSEFAGTKWRALMGPTNPREAPAGTIRFLARDELMIADNIVHGSDSTANVEREIRLVFGDEIWHHVNSAYTIDETPEVKKEIE